MKKQLLYFSMAIMLFSQCATPEKGTGIIVKSTLGEGEKIVSILLDRPVEKAGYLPVFINGQGDTIASQMMNENASQGINSLLALSFEKDSIHNLKVKWVSENDYPKFEPRTNIRIGYSANKDKNFEVLQSHVRPEGHVQGNYIYQAEGPIWESELVGFRTYFDPRNGKDIFGKTKYQLSPNEIGVSGNYHELQDWGMDILKVGNSLGAGALAIVRNDSLLRLGQTERAEAKILKNGPILSQLLLDYDGWNVEGKNYNVDEIISITAGQRWYKSEVTLEGGTVNDTLATGIVNLHDLPAKSFEYNGYHVYYTHGAQSFINDVLGMAVIVSDECYAGFGAAPKTGEGVTKTYTAHLKTSQGKYSYYFYAGWEKENSGFKGETFFTERIKSAIDLMNAEVKVEMN